MSQLALDLPRAWPCDRVLLPRQWHAALGYVLTVPHHTPDGRPVDTYSVGRRVEKLLEPRCRSGELNVQTAREEAAKLAEAIVRAMKPPRARRGNLRKDSSGVVTRTCEQSTRGALRWDTT